MSAPKAILLKTLSVNRFSGGATRRRGWYSDKVPRHKFKNGMAINTATVMRKTAAPRLLIHLPMLRPSPAMHIVVAITAKVAPTINHLLVAIHAAPGITYGRRKRPSEASQTDIEDQ